MAEVSVAEIINNLTLAIEKRNKPALPLQEFRFVDIAWNEFNPQKVIAALMDPRESYYGHKEILYAGLVSWCLRPRCQLFIKRSMMRKMMLAITKIERSPTASVIGRSVVSFLKGYYFYDEIYYPVGGLKRLSLSPSKKSFKMLRTKLSSSLDTAIWILKIYHFHSYELSDRRIYLQASLNKASVLLKKIELSKDGSAAVVKSKAKERWAQHKQSIAMAYAADTIDTGNGSLLDQIRDGKTSFKRHGMHLPEWTGRARWLADEVLGKCYEQDTSNETLAYLPNAAAVPIAPPSFDEKQAAKTKSEFVPKPPKRRNKKSA